MPGRKPSYPSDFWGRRILFKLFSAGEVRAVVQLQVSAQVARITLAAWTPSVSPFLLLGAIHHLLFDLGAKGFCCSKLLITFPPAIAYLGMTELKLTRVPVFTQ